MIVTGFEEKEVKSRGKIDEILTLSALLLSAEFFRLTDEKARVRIKYGRLGVQTTRDTCLRPLLFSTKHLIF